MADGPDYTSLWAQVTSPGDAATVLLAGSATFAVDATADILTNCPATAAGVAGGAVALGAKKAVEAYRRARAARVNETRAITRACVAVNLIQPDYPAGAQRLSADIALRRAAVIDDKQLMLSIDETLQAYRERLMRA